MTIKNGDLPASPTIYADMGINGQREIYCDQHGLTKREMFAMAAMQGLCNHSGDYHEFSHLASDAVNYADALLAELERAK